MSPGAFSYLKLRHTPLGQCPISGCFKMNQSKVYLENPHAINPSCADAGHQPHQ